jgi:hypothetical protein
VLHGVVCVQHGSPEKPHSEHWWTAPTRVQTVLVSVQRSPGQQTDPSVPHDSHEPPVSGHTRCSPTVAHVPPGATQLAVVAS